MKEASFYITAGFDPSLHYLRPEAPELNSWCQLQSVALLW